MNFVEEALGRGVVEGGDEREFPMGIQLTPFPPTHTGKLLDGVLLLLVDQLLAGVLTLLKFTDHLPPSPPTATSASDHQCHRPPLRPTASATYHHHHRPSLRPTTSTTYHRPPLPPTTYHHYHLSTLPPTTIATYRHCHLLATCKCASFAPITDHLPPLPPTSITIYRHCDLPPLPPTAITTYYQCDLPPLPPVPPTIITTYQHYHRPP